jgi:tetratricopeptide (TPR) repeat protein
MKSLIRITALILAFSCSAFAQDSAIQKADKLYADRDKVESLKQAVALVEKDVTNYEAMWRLAKFKFYLSNLESEEAQKITVLQTGIAAAERAIKLDTNRVEGHFWLGVTKGKYADLKGGFAALGLVKTVRRELETALKLDPTYARGTIQLALGEMSLRVPRLLGGNDKRGIEMLEAGLKAGQANAELKLALAEQYEKKNRKAEAKKLLEEILKEEDPLRTPLEQTALRNRAQQMLDKLQNQK